MKLRRILSCLMALLLVCSLPVSVLADTWYLEDGSITVSATESGQTVTQGSASKDDDAPVITQRDSETTTTNTVTIKVEENATANVTIQDVNIVISDTGDHSGEAAVTITAEENAAANVTLNDVNIDVRETGDHQHRVPGEAAVQITGEGDVTIELDGENTVQSGVRRAGVEKNDADSSGKLTITDENGTDGSLEATGGIYGSGIGGGWEGSGSDITITGSAEVTANGGMDAAGIGGGAGGSGSNITITGNAEVTAQGNDGGAGIGGGTGGSGSNITITGSAEVTAKGGTNGAGIGGGYNYNGNGTGSNITISGDAQVKAQGGESLVNPAAPFADGAGAAIGNGGMYQHGTTDADPLKGQEVEPNTDDLNEGWIAKYNPGTIIYGNPDIHTPGTNMDTDPPDSLTYRDASGIVQTATENITIEAVKPATADTHGHNAGFRVGNELVAVTTHNYGTYTADDNATCTHDGTESAKCTVPGCTAKLERTIPGSMKQHEFVNYVPDADHLATCTEDGTKTAKCENCTATDTITDTAKGHNMGAPYTTKEPTCQEEGIERSDCKNCDYYETSPLKKVDHSYGEFSSDDNATCTEDGTKTAECDHGCGKTDTVTDEGSALGHSFTNYVSDGNATCTADGTKTAECDHGCVETDTVTDEGSALGHSFTNYVSDGNATYTADGTKTAKCDHEGCGETDTVTDEGSQLPFYLVKDEDGRRIPCQEQKQDGVLTITVDADFAVLTGTLGGMQALKGQGVDTIVFVTNGANSTFAIEDLLAQGSAASTYILTHDGETVTFTLGDGTDIGKILK